MRQTRVIITKHGRETLYTSELPIKIQQCILQLAEKKHSILEVFREVRKLRDTALLDEQISAELADMQQAGLVRVH